MTEQLDYTDWTWEQHAAKAAELAAKADQVGDSEIRSEAARRMSDVQQIAARGWLHIQIAQLKKSDAVVTAAPADAEPTLAGTPSAKPAAAAPKARPRQTGDGVV